MLFLLESASNKYNSKIHPTPPMIPNTICGCCNNVCIDSNGNRVTQPHTARACAVSGVWYCGDCKKKLMKKSKHVYGPNGDMAMAYGNDFGLRNETEIVYKCKHLKGQHRKWHQS